MIIFVRFIILSSDNDECVAMRENAVAAVLMDEASAHATDAPSKCMHESRMTEQLREQSTGYLNMQRRDSRRSCPNESDSRAGPGIFRASARQCGKKSVPRLLLSVLLSAASLHLILSQASAFSPVAFELKEVLRPLALSLVAHFAVFPNAGQEQHQIYKNE